MVYYVGIFNNYKIGKKTAYFKEVIEINPLEKDTYVFIDIMKDKPLPYETIRHDATFYALRYFSCTNIFYDLEEIREKGKKARGNMERRAVNLIVRNLIGDEYFDW